MDEIIAQLTTYSERMRNTPNTYTLNYKRLFFIRWFRSFFRFLNKSKKITVISTVSLLMIGVSFLIYNYVANGNIHFLDPESFNGKFLYIFSLSLLLFKLCFLLFLFISYQKYKPTQTVSHFQLPKTTVIVPAYNEGKQVYDTLISLSQSDYPKEKLQLISIDDGSVDDTWSWIQKAKQELGDQVIIFKQPKNMGKRAALHRGFLSATGDIFVTVDSDSIVLPTTIGNLVSPFVANPNCGAVAGNVRVLNKEKGLIPQMLNVSFAFSFEFIRSAQSIHGSVLCTPGALSAYRKTNVMNCLEDWLNQTFLGNKTNIGEDRAMTNMILKQGADVVFQKDAKVYTDIPENYKSLKKMFTRWERSNVRENIMMTKFAVKNYKEGNKLAPRFILINQWMKIIFAYPALILMIMFLIVKPLLFLSVMFFGILVFSTMPALFYYIKYSNFKDALLAYSYSVFYAFSLFWITPYAIVTAGNNKWLTRQL